MSRLQSDAADCVRDGLQRLAAVWDELGLVAEERRAREQEVLQHIERLVGTMATQEENTLKALQESVASLSTTVVELSRELETAVPKTSTKNIVELEESLLETVDQLKKEREARLESLVELESRMEILQASLMISNPSSSESAHTVCNISLSRISQLQSQINEYERELHDRKIAAKETFDAVLRLWDELDQTPATPFEKEVAKGLDRFTLSPSNILALQRLKEQLEQTKVQKKAELDSLRQRIQALWARLEISTVEQRSFLAQFSDYSKATRKAVQAEWERLQRLRSKNIRRFVEASRDELAKWWSKCHFGDAQRQMFAAAYADEYTEEVLAEHEAEVARIQGIYEGASDLFALVEKRESIVKRLSELERQSSDSDRLNNRGGKLLLEEKFRKTALKDLPKIERDIIELAATWERIHGTDFTVNDERYIDMLTNQKEEERMAKEREKAEKQRQKQEQLIEELHFGSVPRTPKRRGTLPTADAAKTPKARKASAASVAPQSATKRPAVTPGHTGAAAPAAAAAAHFAISSAKKQAVAPMAVRAPLTEANRLDLDDHPVLELSEMMAEKSCVDNVDGTFSAFLNGISDKARSSNIHFH
eukprot:m.97997 g.97997  ORF g.97997 m.97997 type:complete len:596 (+) comp15548_c0_seq1:137-1924(+)